MVTFKVLAPFYKFHLITNSFNFVIPIMNTTNADLLLINLS